MSVRSVAVLGSCITRDNFNSRFNPEYKTWFRVASSTNQSSMIALMSPPVDEPWEPVRPMKPYGLWNVGSDLSREILDLLREDPPDLLVLDFFGDIHFGVLQMADGRFLTDNRWRIHKTDLYQRLMADEGTRVLHWQDDEEGYFALWVDAMDRFAEYVATHCPQTRVVVHCDFNAHEVLKPESPTPGWMGPDGPKARTQARRANAYWARLNQHAVTAYGWEGIDLGDEWYVSFSDHPWGPFAVHYTMDYYHRFLAELQRLVLRAEQPALAARVDELAEAAADRVRAELEHWQAVARAEETDGRPRTGWRRLVRRTPAPADLTRPDPATGADHELLARLRADVDDATYERLAQLPRSADEHVAFLREVWTARVELRRAEAARG